MVVVAQLVRASDCGSEGRGFEPHLPPEIKEIRLYQVSFFIISFFFIISQKIHHNPTK